MQKLYWRDYSISENNSITVFLGDDNFQFLSQKTGWTKAQYRMMDTGNIDDYPVYTATQEPVAYVEKQTEELIHASTETPVISFGSNGDGSAGTNFVYHSKPFYVSNDRTCVKVMNHKINPFYVYYKLYGMKKTYGFDFHYKATPKMLRLSLSRYQ
jgi:type I restriction enzyme M protein